MKLLFDFITLQDKYINGGNIYTRIVLQQLLTKNIEIYGLYDKKEALSDELQLLVKEHNIVLIPYSDELDKEIDKNNIDVFFIGVAQRYKKLHLLNIKCEIKIVWHDIGDLCTNYGDKIYNKDSLRFYADIVKSSGIKKTVGAYCFCDLLRKYLESRVVKSYDNLSKLITKKNVTVYTVSEYSKNAIDFFFPNVHLIKVFYSPLKNDAIAQVEKQRPELYGKKYFVLVNCDRKNKNLRVFIQQWEQFSKKTNYEFYAVLVGKIKVNLRNIISIDYVTSAELENLYKNSYALVYPSLAEGFGYPPIECMKYGVPVVSTNATSLPEVCGDAAVYFNPLYPEDLYRAMLIITQKREIFSKKAKTQANTIIKKQEEDLMKLIEDITNN